MVWVGVFSDSETEDIWQRLPQQWRVDSFISFNESGRDNRELCDELLFFTLHGFVGHFIIYMFPLLTLLF